MVAALSCSRPADDPQAHNLADDLARASVTAPAPVLITWWPGLLTLRGQELPSLFMHPPSQVEFPPVTLGKLPVFLCAIGLDDSVAAKPGDGVDFVISVRQADGNIAEVWSRYIDSRKNDADKGWQQARVSLEKFAGQTVSLILSTSVGAAGDSQFDWAFWGRPQLLADSR